MPNLIHSLNATSLSLLFHEFYDLYSCTDVQFFSVHDCFGTTCDKIFRLKTILASVYTDLYSSEPYLLKYDKQVLDSIESSTDYVVDRINKTVKAGSDIHKLHDLEWVFNRKIMSSKIIKEIESQYYSYNMY